MSEWRTIKVTSGYGGNTRVPFVEINMELLNKPMQLSPEEARDLAGNLLQAAEAAEQDAFIFEFHTHLSGGEEQVGAAMLMEFMKWRDEHGQDR